MRKSISHVLIGTAVLAVTACGGGGGDSAPTPPASVPLAQAVKNVQTTGLQKLLTLTGTASDGTQTVNISGSIQYSTSGFKTPATFNGQPALSATTTLNGTLTANGTSIPLAATTQEFVTSSYVPLGVEGPSTYCVATSSTPLPASASVGTTGTYVSYACYSDSTMTTRTGTQTISYSVTAGTASSNLTATLISVALDTSNRQYASEQDAYLIDTSGAVTLQSVALTETVNGILLTLTGR
jgi:hypothetical protein